MIGSITLIEITPERSTGSTRYLSVRSTRNFNGFFLALVKHKYIANRQVEHLFNRQFSASRAVHLLRLQS